MSNLSYIAEDLQGLAIPVNECIADPKNVRRHPERNMTAIKDSLKKFGQRKPIVVQKTAEGYVVRAGNGTLAATKSLKREFIAAVKVIEDDKDATAFALADNRTAELAEWDDWGLAEQLIDLQNNDFNIDNLGWNQKELDKIIRSVAGKVEDNTEKKSSLKTNQEYLVVVSLDDESDQSALYEELLGRGLNCKIMS